MNRLSQLLVLSMMVLSFQSLGPVLKASLEQQALVPVLDKVIPIAKQQILSTVIPDISDKSSYYSLLLQNLKVTNVVIPSGAITVAFQNNQIQVKMTGVEVEVVGDAHITALFISSNGVLSVKVQNIQFEADFTDTMNANNRLAVAANNVVVNTGNIDISITGDIGASILNLFTSFIKSTVQSTIISEAKAALQDSLIFMANQFLNTFPYELPCPAYPFSVHYNPTQAISSANGLLGASVAAYSFITGNPSLPNIAAPVEMNPSAAQSSFLRVLLSDYVLNSLFYTIQQSGFEVKVNQTLINSFNDTSLNNLMNTNTFDQLIPGFVNAFGANTPVQLVFSSKNQANLAITQANISGSLSQHVVIQIMDSTGVYKTQAYFDAAVQVVATVALNNQMISANIVSAQCTSSSTDHPFLTNNIQAIIDKEVSAINYIVNKGVLLPSISIGQLTNSQVVLHNGYLELQSSFELFSTVATAQIISGPATHLIKRCLNKKIFKNKFNRFFIKNAKKIQRLYKYQINKAN